jgi:hypothetical protein
MPVFPSRLASHAWYLPRIAKCSQPAPMPPRRPIRSLSPRPSRRIVARNNSPTVFIPPVVQVASRGTGPGRLEYGWRRSFAPCRFTLDRARLARSGYWSFSSSQFGAARAGGTAASAQRHAYHGKPRVPHPVSKLAEEKHGGLCQGVPDAFFSVGRRSTSCWNRILPLTLLPARTSASVKAANSTSPSGVR